MTLEPPTEAAGDLMEDVVTVALRLVATVRDEGPAAVAGVLASLPDDHGVFAPTPGGIYGALAVACAAMVDTEAHPTDLLAWITAQTEPVTTETKKRGRPIKPVLAYPEGRTRRTRPRLPREHGTDRGYFQHRTAREEVCPDCRAAHRVKNRPEVCQQAYAELVAAGMSPARAADETTLPRVLAGRVDQLRGERTA